MVAMANETASMAKAGPVCTRAIMAPASAGPMRPMICCAPWTSALAGESSRSGTSIGTIVLSAG